MRDCAPVMNGDWEEARVERDGKESSQIQVHEKTNVGYAWHLSGIPLALVDEATYVLVC